MTEPYKRRSLTGTRHTDEAKNQKQPSKYIRIAREIAAILAIGTMFWTSVFGMADDLASGPMVPAYVAEVTDGR